MQGQDYAVERMTALESALQEKELASLSPNFPHWQNENTTC